MPKAQSALLTNGALAFSGLGVEATFVAVPDGLAKEEVGWQWEAIPALAATFGLFGVAIVGPASAFALAFPRGLVLLTGRVALRLLAGSSAALPLVVGVFALA